MGRIHTEPINAGFSIKKIECKTCGGSFDGSHQRKCPFCQNVYDMKEENWVITRIGGFDDQYKMKIFYKNCD